MKEMEVLRVRLDLGRTYLALPPPKLDIPAAEAELGIVERVSKAIIRRIRRGPRNRNPVNSLDDDGQFSAQARAKSSNNGQKGVLDERQEDRGEASLIKALVEMRIEALREMVRVEELLGRDGRAERWRKAIQEAESEYDSKTQD